MSACTCTLTHTHTHSIAGVVVEVVDVLPPQVTGANGSCAGAEEDTLINTHHNNSFLARIHKHMWQSWTEMNIILLRSLSVLLHLKHSIIELSLRAGLRCTLCTCRYT